MGQRKTPETKTKTKKQNGHWARQRWSLMPCIGIVGLLRSIPCALARRGPSPSLMCVTLNHKPPTHQHAFVWDNASNCNAIG